MRCLTITAVMLVICSCVWAAVPAGFTQGWDEVRAAARAEQKPIYLHFTTTWCGWCRKIESETYQDPVVNQILQNDFVAASLDCTVPRGELPEGNTKVNLDMLDRFGGSGYPYLVMLSSDGEAVLNVVGGYVTPPELLTALRKAVTLSKAYQGYQAFASAADKESYEYAARTMRMQAEFQVGDLGVAMAQRVRALDLQNEFGDAAEAIWVQLTALSDEAWESEGSSLYVDLTKYDPVNDRNMLEPATLHYAMQQMKRAQAHPETAQQSRQRAAELLATLTRTASALHNEQQVYGMLGLVQRELGRKTDAMASLEHAIAVNPKSAQAQQLASALEELRKP